MTKTNKEIRSDFAKEMYNKYNERNEQLNQIGTLPIPEDLKEQNRKAIMENFEKQMDEIKGRPGYEEARNTHLEEIKVKSGVRKVKSAVEDEQEELENSEIPQELKDFREKWKERIQDEKWKPLSNEIKEKIVKATKKIPVKVEEEPDGSVLIEFKLGNKTYKILDLRLKTHSDDKYYVGNDGIKSFRKRKECVYMGGMKGDAIDNWENFKLKIYVEKKEKEGLHIPKIEEMKNLLDELGKEADLRDESDKIAMLMYLTGMDGNYWLSMGTDKSSGSQDWRTVFVCLVRDRKFLCNYHDDFCAGLCLIACE